MKLFNFDPNIKIVENDEINLVKSSGYDIGKLEANFNIPDIVYLISGTITLK